ncbi:MAG: STAS domain-containing protein [Planctomycetaceae bacterium]
MAIRSQHFHLLISAILFISGTMKLKIFQHQQLDNIVILTPLGDGTGFRYQELHVDVNAIRAEMAKPGNRHLILNLEHMEYFGSEFIGGLVSMLRETKNRGGLACFANATPQMMQVLKTMSLFKLWPHFNSQNEAIAAAKEKDAPPS